MVISAAALPNDIEALKRLVLAREADLVTTRADLIQSQSRASNAEALIAHLRLAIEKMRREVRAGLGNLHRTISGVSA